MADVATREFVNLSFRDQCTACEFMLLDIKITLIQKLQDQEISRQDAIEIASRLNNVKTIYEKVVLDKLDEDAEDIKDDEYCSETMRSSPGRILIKAIRFCGFYVSYFEKKDNLFRLFRKLLRYYK